MLSFSPERLTEGEIARLLREQPPLPPHGGQALAGGQLGADLRPAAVLVPLLVEDGQWRLLFTRRTETLASHRGQVSFPGGAADPTDQSPEQTALREAFEEIGLLPEDCAVLGRMTSLPTISHFLVTPVVARIPWPYTFNPSTNEVSRVFTIPLAWLADPANRQELPREIAPGHFQNVIYYQHYDGELLWGATARMTVDLLRVLSLE